jgi:hypothetical protein
VLFLISATFWGDPHIETMDGATYTFNGLGEYTLLDISKPTENGATDIFVLQARTSLAINANGEEINATIFSGFAAKDSSGATMQVQLSENDDSKYMYFISEHVYYTCFRPIVCGFDLKCI